MATRDRILTAAMRLFADQGFAGTSIAQIEQAAGLSPGAGGIYRHFPSKDAVLSAGIRERIAQRDELLPLLESLPVGPLPAQVVLGEIARAGLTRLHDERDLSLILVRDLARHPELLEFFRDAELRTNHAALVGVLRAVWPQSEADLEAVAAIFIDAVSHYWLMSHIYGGVHPTGVTQQRYLSALAGLAPTKEEK